MYAACGSSSSGSIRVIQADQTVEVLYESGADYPGISGMWSIPAWPGADFHSLLVLSFASGSRAMATGTVLFPFGSVQFWNVRQDETFTSCSMVPTDLWRSCVTLPIR